MIEIVSEKDDETYRRLFKKYDITPKNFWMVGNSLKSDILPVVRLGSHGVYIPYTSTWVRSRPNKRMPRNTTISTAISGLLTTFQ